MTDQPSRPNPLRASSRVFARLGAAMVLSACAVVTFYGLWLPEVYWPGVFAACLACVADIWADQEDRQSQPQKSKEPPE